MRAEPRSLLRVRLMARAPRAALIGACALLALAGLRTTITGGAATAAPLVAPAPGADLAVSAFAEAFARAYLTYRGDDPAAHERAVAAFASGDLDPGAGLEPPATGSQRVSWTAAMSSSPAGQGRWRVTVAVALAGEGLGLRYLSVPVARGAGGALVVDDYPALVGPPARADRSAPADAGELTDRALADVASRALGNYLRGAAGNLRADLLPGARVTTPSPALRLVAVEALAWRLPGRLLAATVSAQDPGGARMRLRFLLRVEHRDRWYLRAVNDPSPPTKGPTP